MTFSCLVICLPVAISLYPAWQDKEKYSQDAIFKHSIVFNTQLYKMKISRMIEIDTAKSKRLVGKDTNVAGDCQRLPAG
jgi:hypothetical protein